MNTIFFGVMLVSLALTLVAVLHISAVLGVSHWTILAAMWLIGATNCGTRNMR